MSAGRSNTVARRTGRFGEHNPEKHIFGKIELCNFTASLKQEIFPKLRMAFENRRLRIPVSRVLREDLHSVHRVTTLTGQISYRAAHTEDGHADRCTALALAVRASESAGYAGNFYRISQPSRHGLARISRALREVIGA